MEAKPGAAAPKFTTDAASRNPREVQEMMELLLTEKPTSDQIVRGFALAAELVPDFFLAFHEMREGLWRVANNSTDHVDAIRRLYGVTMAYDNALLKIGYRAPYEAPKDEQA